MTIYMHQIDSPVLENIPFLSNTDTLHDLVKGIVSYFEESETTPNVLLQSHRKAFSSIDNMEAFRMISDVAVSIKLCKRLYVPFLMPSTDLIDLEQHHASVLTIVYNALVAIVDLDDCENTDGSLNYYSFCHIVGSMFVLDSNLVSLTLFDAALKDFSLPNTQQ